MTKSKPNNKTRRTKKSKIPAKDDYNAQHEYAKKKVKRCFDDISQHCYGHTLRLMGSYWWDLVIKQHVINHSNTNR